MLQRGLSNRPTGAVALLLIAGGLLLNSVTEQNPTQTFRNLLLGRSAQQASHLACHAMTLGSKMGTFIDRLALDLLSTKRQVPHDCIHIKTPPKPPSQKLDAIIISNDDCVKLAFLAPEAAASSNAGLGVQVLPAQRISSCGCTVECFEASASCFISRKHQTLKRLLQEVKQRWYEAEHKIAKRAHAVEAKICCWLRNLEPGKIDWI